MSTSEPTVREPPPGASASLPLAVDLDGTLVRSDTLVEGLLALARHRPAALASLPGWWMRGRACLKREVALQAPLDPVTFPYHSPFLDWLREQRRGGRRLVLATAADHHTAAAVAGYLGIFDEVLASDGETNLKGAAKVAALQQKYPAGFVYAGDSRADLPVWRAATTAVIVGATAGLVRQVSRECTVERVFLGLPPRAGMLARVLRVHQWAKNLLLVVPALAAHRLAEPLLFVQTVEALTAFCLCASSAYVINDLLDLDADRRHPSKSRRPFAAGEVQATTGLGVSAALLAAGLGISVLLPLAFTAILIGYWTLTLAYSLWLKRLAALDVVVLASLYNVRILAGSVATGVPTSSWLFTLSMFLFLSLALVKRTTELRRLRHDQAAPAGNASGRGYSPADLEQVAGLGMASGLVSVLVLALYLSSADVVRLYPHHQRLWLICPLALYWVVRVWLLAQRGLVHEDPVVFALRDPGSYLVGALAALVILSGS